LKYRLEWFDESWANGKIRRTLVPANNFGQRIVTAEGYASNSKQSGVDTWNPLIALSFANYHEKRTTLG